MPGVQVVLRPAALEDLKAAAEWYSAQVPTLGPRFEAAVQKIVDQIAEWPKVAPKVDEKTRKALLKGFPYSIYYWQPDPSTVEILAILHQSRHPDTWRRSSGSSPGNISG